MHLLVLISFAREGLYLSVLSLRSLVPFPLSSCRVPLSLTVAPGSAGVHNNIYLETPLAQSHLLLSPSPPPHKLFGRTRSESVAFPVFVQPKSFHSPWIQGLDSLLNITSALVWLLLSDRLTRPKFPITREVILPLRLRHRLPFELLHHLPTLSAPQLSLSLPSIP